MTKAGEKLLSAAKDAIETAKCVHDLVPQPTERGSSLDKFYCRKCRATIWEPKIGRIR
jgi:hypothetical protein